MKQDQAMLIPPIYVDLDDVIAETLRAFAQLVNRMYGKSISFEDIFSFDLGKSFELNREQLRHYLEVAHSREILLREVVPNSKARMLMREWEALGAHITVVTGRPISTYTDTLEWLRLNHIPFHALCFLRKYGRNDLGSTTKRPLDIRTLPSASFLFAVEDNLKMADYLAIRVKTPVLLIDKPWNRQINEPRSSSLVTRCADWSEIRAHSLYYLKDRSRLASL